MPRAVSIHIGVNEPGYLSRYDARARLRDSEDTAWRMAELASQAGYSSILVLRAETATLGAVSAALWNASQLLAHGDTLLVTFSGHSGQMRDPDGDERNGSDESWSLHDGELLDDTLFGYWRLFKEGVRIAVVSERSYSGGMGRTGSGEEFRRPAASEQRRRMRGGRDWIATDVAEPIGAAAVEHRDISEVRATVLILSASSEDQLAQAGLFTDCLLGVWADGTFSGSYLQLFTEAKNRVTSVRSAQEPQILTLGRYDPEFLLSPAFHVHVVRGPSTAKLYRGEAAPLADAAVQFRARSPIARMGGSQRAIVRSSLVNRLDHWLHGSLSRISDDDVLRALEAQSPAEAIAEILVATPEARATSENDWAELLLRGAEAKKRVAGLVGGLLSSFETAEILGISVPDVEQWVNRHKLLAVPLSAGQWGFPALQFQEGGHVRAGVPEVAKAAAGHDLWTVLSILVDDVADGAGLLLEHLDDPAVLRDAVHRLQTYGEHVAG